MMTLNLDWEADRLARKLSKQTGESVSEAVVNALRERLARTEPEEPDLKEALLRIGRECAQLPVLDDRDADDILGYDEHGLPSDGDGHWHIRHYRHFVA